MAGKRSGRARTLCPIGVAPENRTPAHRRGAEDKLPRGSGQGLSRGRFRKPTRASQAHSLRGAPDLRRRIDDNPGGGRERKRRHGVEQAELHRPDHRTNQVDFVPVQDRVACTAARRRIPLDLAGWPGRTRREVARRLGLPQPRLLAHGTVRRGARSRMPLSRSVTSTQRQRDAGRWRAERIAQRRGPGFPAVVARRVPVLAPTHGTSNAPTASRSGGSSVHGAPARGPGVNQPMQTGAGAVAAASTSARRAALHRKRPTEGRPTRARPTRGDDT